MYNQNSDLMKQEKFMLPTMIEGDFSAEELAEDADGLQMSFQRVKIPAGGTLQFEMPSDDPDNPDYEKNLVGVILHNHATCAYWPAGSEYDDDTTPLCSSVDPLTVGPGERGRDFEYCLCLDRHRSHFTGSRVSVKDWLYQNFKREDKEYVKREYEIATELGKLMRAIAPAMRQGIVFKVLYYRYYNFDLDQPFQPQYEQNNRHLLADLHRIAGEQ